MGYHEGGVELALPILIKVIFLYKYSLIKGSLLILYYYYTTVRVESQVFMRWGAGTELLHPLGLFPLLVGYCPHLSV